MLYYNRINLNEGIGVAKRNNSKKCIVFHYWYFNHGYKFQNSVCNGCYGLTILRLNLSDIAIIIIKNVDHCCIIHNISKSDTVLLLKNSVLDNRA